MKCFFLVLACIFYFGKAEGQKTPSFFTLNGEIQGAMNGFVYLEYTNSDGKAILDSCLLFQGRFKFRGYIKEPTVAFLMGPEKSTDINDPNSSFVFLEPGNLNSIVTVKGFKNTTIHGSKSQSQWVQISGRRQEVLTKWKSKLDSLMNTNDITDSLKSENREEILAKYHQEDSSIVYSFINEYPNSVVSAYLMKSVDFSDETVKQLFSRLSSLVQNSRYGRIIKKQIEINEALSIGKQAPDFSIPDTKGKTVSLKSFKGKYVLLDFWASWCLPCRAEYPFLLGIYDKYKNKNFTIIGVSLDENKKDWLEAIEKDKLVWTQLSDLKGSGSGAALQYNISAIPANYLIDPSGRIIAKELFGNELENAIARLLK